MELIGIQRPRGRDLATGIVLGAGLGLAALFLYLDTTYRTPPAPTVTDPVRLDLCDLSSSIPPIARARGCCR